MSLRLRITEPPSLCQRCSYGTSMRRAAGARITWCRSIGRLVPDDVAACTDYMPIGTKPPAPWDDRVHPLIIDTRPNPGQAL